MSDRLRIGRVAGVGRVGMGALGPHNILTVRQSGANPWVRVTTAAPHGLADTTGVTISGTSDANYNGLADAITLVSATVFDMPGVSYDADATGGRWD